MGEERGRNIELGYCGYCFQCHLSLLLVTKTENHIMKSPQITHNYPAKFFLNICHILKVIEIYNPRVTFWTSGIWIIRFEPLFIQNVQILIK